MTKGRAVTIIPNGEDSRGVFRLRPQTGEKLYSKANRERKKKAEAVKSEAISRRTKRRLSKPKRKLGAGARNIGAVAVRSGRTRYKAVQSGAGSRAGISGECKPRDIRRVQKRERTLSPGESGGRIYGVDRKIRKAR